MRATQSQHRRGLAAGLISISLLALSILGSGAASAANSRIVYVGTGLVNASGQIIDNVINATGVSGHDGIPDNAGAPDAAGIFTGILVPTKVSAGYTTVVPIQVLNGDNQTVAHVNFTFPSAGTTLTSGLTISGHDGAGCTDVRNPAQVITSVTCNFDNLAAGASRSVLIYVATTAATTAANLFTAQVTTNNENGSNLQLFMANSRDFKVAAAGDDGLDAFAQSGKPLPSLKTNDPSGSNKLGTRVDFSQSASGNFVEIAETDGGSTAFLYKCPDGQSCQPFESTITVQDGLSGTAATFDTSPFLKVTLTALVPKTYTLSKAFVAHYGADVTKPDWVLFWNTKSTKCGSDPAAKMTTVDQCFLSATLSKPDANGFETVVLTVLMKHNGGTRM